MTVITTVCRPKPSGNTRLAPVRQLHTSENSMRLPGTAITPTTQPIPLDKRNQTPGVFSTWKATSRNGSKTCTRPTTTAIAPPSIRPGRKAVVAEEEDSAVVVRLRMAVEGLEASVDAAADSADRRRAERSQMALHKEALRRVDLAALVEACL